ncbi:HNH endonuclease signature motif containing protein [Arthrobacter sp. H14-L1]|uniref:HNH endonuclease signature motif containing protein n=1 Tax=Arthrobacter sp. H14-L1 TaxID=2996697 RepID=UPI00226F6825|nr:HNH endonuclease signature motif containing protein [Arthrobacter sp. H14-L1]MCY0905354.1 DUF222 domain-containing protein [Arthrobacter sp. H14-L1]
MDGFTGASGTPGGAGAQPTTAALLAAVVLPDGSGPGPGTGPDSGRDRLFRPHPGFPARGPDGGAPDPVFTAGVVAADEWLAEQEAVYNASVAALTQWSRLEARVAAGKAREVARLAAAADRIGTGLGLDAWQRQEATASMTAELAAALCLPDATANALLSESITLVHDRPRTLAGLAAGDLSYRHAEVIIDEVGSLTAVAEPGIPAAVAEEFESRLLVVAPGLTVPKLKSLARKWREREHPETMVSRHKAAITKRRLQLTPDRDGMSYLSGYMPAPTAQGIWNRATEAARAAQGPDEPRTLTQLRLDIAAGWLLSNTGQNPGQNPGQNSVGPGCDNGQGKVGDRQGGDRHGSPSGELAGPADLDYQDDQDAGVGSAGGCPLPRAQVLVAIPVFALLGLTDEPADLEGYGPIPPDVARQLAAESPEMIRLLIHPHTGEPLAIGRERYRVSARLRAWLRARDQTCTFPGYNTVTADTQLDHITGWEHGSGTGGKELTDECKKHHLIKHFKDGKNRHGKRTGRFAPHDGSSPDGETSVGDLPGPQLRGWTPSITDTGQTAWTSPAGKYYPPSPPDHHRPRLPKLLTNPVTAHTTAPGINQPWDPCHDEAYCTLFLIDSEIPSDPEGPGSTTSDYS